MKTRKLPTLDDYLKSPESRRRNSHLLPPEPDQSPVVVEARRMRKPILERLNKTEVRWLHEIGWRMEAMSIHPQVGLYFDDGDCYNADFMVFMNDGGVRLIEVKGGYKGPGWEQGHERFKRAKATWPHLRFELWTWDGKLKTWAKG